MTRWKKAPTTVLILMHEHNRWSNWYSELEYAALCLGLLVGRATYANHYDGSTDRVWYVSTAQLERVGGLSAVEALARKNADEAWAAAHPPDDGYSSDAAW